MGTYEYVPHLYIDELWVQQRYLHPMDPAKTAVNLSVVLTPSSTVEVQTYRTVHESFQVSPIAAPRSVPPAAAAQG